MIRYCAQNAYSFPNGTYKELQSNMNKHKDIIATIINSSKRTDGRNKELVSQIFTKLYDLEGYVYSGTTSMIPYIIAGWKRKNITVDQYDSVIELVSSYKQQGIDDYVVSQKLTSILGIPLTEYHTKYIQQEQSGDRQIDIDWWKSQLINPWIKHQLESNTFLNATNLFKQLQQLFADRQPISYDTLNQTIRMLGGQNKLRNDHTMTRWDTFIKNNKSDIMDIVDNQVISQPEKLEIINFKYKDVIPRQFNRIDLSLMRRTLGKDVDTYRHVKQNLAKETLKNLVPEIQEMYKTCTIDQVMSWLMRAKGIKTNRRMLSQIGAVPEIEPVSENGIVMKNHITELYRMRKEGYKTKDIARWLLINHDITVSNPTIHNFFSTYKDPT